MIPIKLSSDDYTRRTTIAAILKTYREEKGLTQAQFAEKAGIDRVSLAKIELCKRDIQLTTLLKLCDAMEIDIMLVPRLLKK